MRKPRKTLEVMQHYATQSTVSDATLWSIARTVAREWYRLQVRDLSAYLYVWHRARREGETIALPIVSADCPAEGYTRGLALSPMWGEDTATREIHDAMRAWPIL